MPQGKGVPGKSKGKTSHDHRAKAPIPAQSHASQAPSNEELASLQSTEIDVLASIFGDDFKRVEADASTPWNKTPTALPSSGSQFDIVLRPDTDDLKQHVRAVTRFRLPIRYPLLPPIITILAPDGSGGTAGMSIEQTKLLESLLVRKAKEIAGAGEMIWELVSLGSEWISEHNQHLRQDVPNISLEEEKLLREKEREQAKQIRAEQESDERNKVEAKRTSKIADLIQEQASQQTAAIRDERERQLKGVRSPGREDVKGFNHSPIVTFEANARTSGRWTETFIDAIECGSVRTNTIVVGPLLRETGLSAVHLVESATESCCDKASWMLECFPINGSHYSLTSGKRKLQEVEYELDKMRSLRADSLVNVLASALINNHDSTRKILIVTETIEGPSARLLLSHCLTLPWTRARGYLLDIVSALDALHGRNLLHRDVSLDNVYLTGGVTPNRENPGAKLAHAGYWRRLHDLDLEHALVEGRANAPTNDLPGGWEAAELSLDAHSSSLDRKSATYSRKRDIWQVGVVALQMLFGEEVISRYSSVDAFLRSDEPILEELEAHVVLLLKSMLEKSTRKRPSAGELKARLEDVIRYETEERIVDSQTAVAGRDDAEDKAGLAPQTRRRLTRGISEQENLQVFRPGSFWQYDRSAGLPATGAGSFSRYESDFEEIELLGKGAYGAVFRAKNRLDGRDYAIKKIRLSPSAGNDEKTLREISALSRLSHQNIVRYVTCWIQTQEEKDAAAASSSGDVLTSSRSMQVSSRDFVLPGLDDFLSVGHDAFSSAGQNVRFAHSDSESDEEEEEEEDIPKKKAITRATPEEEASSDSESDESDDSSCAASSSGQDIVQRSRRKPVEQKVEPTPNAPRWLFIQMEYVENQTLREAIDRGLSIDECWRLFRQMIEALAHVASLGIIHRDLKPSNILMFGGGVNEEGEYIAGDIKIGDFGLATTAPQQHTTAYTGSGVYGNTEDSADLTTEIGTNLYIAPEVDKAGSRYDFKVDVYAAGIVFFEMLASQRVYKTGMERISVLRDLRRAEINFPKGWNEGQLQAQTKVIRSLLAHDPASRPSPLELLKSELLPPKMEDEYIAECLRLLSMPNSTYNLQLMDSLFTQKEEFEQREARDFTFDTGSNAEEGQGLDNRFIGVACHLLRGLFHRRGAVELQSPLLIPPNELYKEEQKPVEFLDKTGKVVQLPYDLVVPFARMVARGEQQRFKRYAIGRVYRNNVLAGGQPRSVVEVDFDIVAPDKTPAAEAEAISVVDEILEELPGFSSSEWVIQISHAQILDLLLERVPAQHRNETFRAIGTLFNGTKTAASDMRQRLSSLGLGIPRSVLDEIEMANLSDDVGAVHEKLQRFIALDLRPKLAKAVEEIQSVVDMARHFGVQRRFLFTPLLITNRAFYKDNVFFVFVRARGKRRDVLASGGRYDALIRRFTNPTSPKTTAHAVGVQIGLGRIALALAKYQDLISSVGGDRGMTPFTPSRCDVYVASASDLLSLRMEICKELWAANISADLAYEHALENSPELLASTCRAEGILFLVIARARNSSVVKVKSIFERGEYEVNRWELSAWLTDRIGRIKAGSGASSTDYSNMSTNERSHHHHSNVTTTIPSFNPLEAEVLLPERYSTDKRKIDKHGNNERRIKKHLAPIQENSIKQVTRLMEEMMMASSSSASMTSSSVVPSKTAIIAVDVPSVMAFSRLCGAALARTDEGLWKLFMESMSSSPEEREYARTIRRRFEEMHASSRAWLVPIRNEGGRCTLV